MTPRFEGRNVPRTFVKKAAFLARDGVVFFDNPDGFLVCALKRDIALCDAAPGATAPRPYDFRPGCGNAVRIDTHACLLRERAGEIDHLAVHSPGPLGRRLRAHADKLRTMADDHDITAQSAEAPT